MKFSENYNFITYIDKNNAKLQEVHKVIDSIIHKGKWNYYEHKIRINPITKLRSMISKKQKGKMDSIIRHEIDHCATTEYIDIDERKKEEYIQKCIKRYI